MAWIIFFIASMIVFFVTKTYKRWGQLWYAGIIALAAVYLIDSTFIKLGAFSYTFIFSLAGGLPLFYWLSSFWGGMVLVRYFPHRSLWKLPYILLAAFIFLLLELIMHFLGYFNYHNWTPLTSFFLDVAGFTVVIWLWSWINEVRKKEV